MIPAGGFEENPQTLAIAAGRSCQSSIYSRFGFDEDAAAIAKLPKLAGAAG